MKPIKLKDHIDTEFGNTARDFMLRRALDEEIRARIAGDEGNFEALTAAGARTLEAEINKPEEGHIKLLLKNAHGTVLSTVDFDVDVEKCITSAELNPETGDLLLKDAAGEVRIEIRLSEYVSPLIEGLRADIAAEAEARTEADDALREATEALEEDCTERFAEAEGRMNDLSDGLDALGQTVLAHKEELDGEIAAEKAARAEGDAALAASVASMHVAGNEGKGIAFNDSGAAASGSASAAFGESTKAYGAGAFAIGFGNEADYYSFAGGMNSAATAATSFAFGDGVKASGEDSAAFGDHTVACCGDAFVVGRYNVIDSVLHSSLFTVGNGDEMERSNAFVVYADGHAEVKEQGESNKSVAQKAYVDSAIVGATEAIAAERTRAEAIEGELASEIGALHITSNISDGDGANSLIQRGDKTEFTVNNKNASNFGDTARVESAGPKSSAVFGGSSRAVGSRSFAAGAESQAIGDRSIALGNQAAAEGVNSFATGNQATTKGAAAFASGAETLAKGDASFAAGYGSEANEFAAAAFGNYTKANGLTSFAIGNGSYANGRQSFAGGNSSIADYENDFVFGEGLLNNYENQAVFGRFNDNSDWSNPRPLLMIGNGADAAHRSNAFAVFADGHAEIQTQGTTDSSVVVNKTLKDAIEAKADALHIESGSGTGAVQQKQDGATGKFSFTGKNPHATALDSALTGDINYGGTGAFAAVFGGKAAAMGKRSLAEGTTTVAKGNYSHAEGDNSVALGSDSHAEGYTTVTGPTAMAAHSEGYETQALAHSSHAEGYQTIASSETALIDRVSLATVSADNPGSSGSDVGGSSAAATSRIASMHAEGNCTRANGAQSHAEGSFTQTLGIASHAEGYLTLASGAFSHAEGVYTTANGYGQTVVGVYNEPNDTDVFIVGAGKNKDELSNALRVLKDGRVLINEPISSGGYNQAATLQYVESQINAIKTTAPVAGKMPVFTADGTLKSGAPVTGDDVATKNYADGEVGRLSATIADVREALDARASLAENNEFAGTNKFNDDVMIAAGKKLVVDFSKICDVEDGIYLRDEIKFLARQELTGDLSGKANLTGGNAFGGDQSFNSNIAVLGDINAKSGKRFLSHDVENSKFIIGNITTNIDLRGLGERPQYSRWDYAAGQLSFEELAFMSDLSDVKASALVQRLIDVDYTADDANTKLQLQLSLPKNQQAFETLRGVSEYLREKYLKDGMSGFALPINGEHSSGDGTVYLITHMEITRNQAVLYMRSLMNAAMTKSIDVMAEGEDIPVRNDIAMDA